jgi:hypothetical protein
MRLLSGLFVLEFRSFAMFLRTIKNPVASGIFRRISAIRMAEHRNIYELAATIVEAVNWASKRMNGFPQECSEKEYNAAHRFWVKLRRVIDKRFIQYINQNDKSEYEVILPDSCLRLVSSHWRSLEVAKHPCICKSPRSCPQCEGWNG